jgi:tRNA 2-thiouridine synthesizing protein A
MDETLDLRGLKCPLPALLAKKALARLAPGSVMTVIADDPMSVVDIRTCAMAKVTRWKA